MNGDRTPTPDLAADRIIANLAVVRERIRAAGGTSVRVIAVTKGFGVETIAAARAAGIAEIGESYAQELLARTDAMAGLSVHFIGRLQSNKVRSVASKVGLWQSVDRAVIASEIARWAPAARVLVQVNVTSEEGKGGCDPDRAAVLVDHCRGLGLVVDGLMAVGRAGPPELARAGFARLRHMVDEFGLEECSMGMTRDLEIAVAEGATMVRVGSALFGARPVENSRFVLQPRRR